MRERRSLGSRFMRRGQGSWPRGTAWRLSQVNGIRPRARLCELRSQSACAFTGSVTTAIPPSERRGSVPTLIASTSAARSARATRPSGLKPRRLRAAREGRPSSRSAPRTLPSPLITILRRRRLSSGGLPRQVAKTWFIRNPDSESDERAASARSCSREESSNARDALTLAVLIVLGIRQYPSLLVPPLQC